MNRYSTLTVTREMQIKTKMQYYYIPVRLAKLGITLNAGEDVENLHQSYIAVRWEWKMVPPLWEIIWQFFSEVKMDLPYDPTVILSYFHTGTCTWMFTAALFVKKPHKCPSVVNG